MCRITRPASWQQDEGIVQPTSKEVEQLSRRLHQSDGHPIGWPSSFFGVMRYCRHMSRYRKVRRLEPVTAAYLAGLIDGEGTVTLTRQHRNEGRRLVVCISNNELGILESAREVIGAGRITTKRHYNERHAASFTYQVSSRQALDLLTQIVQFMRSYKARRARLALDHYPRLTPRNGKYRPEIRQQREDFERRLLGIRPY